MEITPNWKKYISTKNDKVRTASGEYALDEAFYAGLLWNLKGANPNSPIWQQKEKALKNWMEQFPTSPAPRIEYAYLLQQYAKTYRGKGKLKDLTEKNWNLYHDYIKRTQEYLTSIKDVSTSDPHWYVVSIDVAHDTGMSWKEIWGLSTEAATMFPKYYNIYLIEIPHAVNSVESLDSIALNAVNQSSLTSPLDDETFYARMYQAIESEPEYQGKLFSTTLVHWYRMKMGLDEIIEKYPDVSNITRYAYLACQAKDQHKAKELLKRMNGYVKENWRSMTDYTKCKTFAASALSPALQEKWDKFEAAAQANRAYREKVKVVNSSAFDVYESDNMQQKYNEYRSAFDRQQ